VRGEFRWVQTIVATRQGTTICQAAVAAERIDVVLQRQKSKAFMARRLEK